MPFPGQKYGLARELMPSVHHPKHTARALTRLIHAPDRIDEGQHGISADGVGSDFLNIIDIGCPGEAPVLIQCVENGEFDLSPVIR